MEVTRQVEVPITRGSINILTGWGGFELEALQSTMLPFTQETGIGVAFEYTPPGDLAAVLTTRVEAGVPLIWQCCPIRDR